MVNTEASTHVVTWVVYVFVGDVADDAAIRNGRWMRSLVFKKPANVSMDETTHGDMKTDDF